MAGSTIRELTSDPAPALNRLVVTQDPTAGLPTKSTIAELFANMPEVTNAVAADMPAGTIKLRAAGSGTGKPIDGTGAQARTILNVEDGATADQTNAEIETAYNAQVPVASQVEAEAGTSTTVLRWTPERVQQAAAAIAGPTPAASAIVFTPAGTVAATDVQAAIAELDTEKVPTTRTVTSGAGLTGGGALSGDLTFAVSYAGSGASIHVARADHLHTGLLPPVGAEGTALKVVGGVPTYATDLRGEGGVGTSDATASPTTGAPPEPTPLVLDPATNGAGAYVFTEDLTADLEVALSITGQRAGHRIAIHRLGANGAFLFTIVGALGDLDISLSQYETAFLQFDGAAWVLLGKIGQETGGISSFLQTVELITAAASLTAARQMYGVSGSAARHHTLLSKPGTGSAAIVLTLPDDAPLGYWYVVRHPDHTGSLTIVNQSAAGSLNGTNGTTVTVSTAARSAVLIEVFEQAGSACVATVKGDTTENVTMAGLLTVNSVLGTPTTFAGGAMTVALHSGRIVRITGNVTSIPITNGFTCQIQSSGSRTVGAGGATTALTDLQSIVVWVENNVVYRSPIQTVVVMPQS